MSSRDARQESQGASGEHRSLTDLYLDLNMTQGPVELESFLQQVVAGEFGPRNGAEIASFLRSRENEIINNIWLMASANPGLAGQVEGRIAETRLWIESLVAKYAR